MRRAALAMALSLTVPAAAADDSAFVDWARTHAVALPACDMSQPAAMDAMGPVIGPARVVALGEPVHGAHEPLAFRNCLFRYLVERQGFTAIALETGSNESRSLSDYVAGGEGNARDVARRGFTWGFGRYPENVALLDWIRDYNDDPAHKRKIRLYGIDMSGGDGSGAWKNARATLDDSLGFLQRAAPGQSRTLRLRVQSFADRFTVPAYAAMTVGDRARLRSAIGDLIAFYGRNRTALIKASSQIDYDRARQNAIAARQLETLFAVSRLPSETPDLLAGDYRADAARDAAMAANVRWAIDREGDEGRILLFAHNGHVMNARTRGGIWSVYDRAPAAMGEHLRTALGKTLVIIATSGASGNAPASAKSPAETSLDAALAKVAPGRFLLDFRRAGRNTPARRWLGKTHSLRVNSDTENLIVPAAALDAVVSFGQPAAD